MNKTLSLWVVAFMAMANSYSQCACCAGAGAGSSSGDYNNGILTLPKNNWVIETYADYRNINQGNTPPVTDPDEETPLQSMWIQSAGVRYGLTDGITLSALAPYVFLQTDNGNDSGWGDIAVMGTFKVLQKNNFNIALQAGLELPTGTQKNSAFDNTTVVVGSGSYDPMMGVIFSKKWSRLILQANGLYKHTTNGFQGNYYGSIAIQNVSVNYNLLGENASCAMPTDANVETKTTTTAAPGKRLGWSVYSGYYGEWLDSTKEDGITDENSGYYMGFATLGSSISYQKWSFPLTLSLPVIQDMNGDQSSGGFRIRLGIIKAF